MRLSVEFVTLDINTHSHLCFTNRLRERRDSGINSPCSETSGDVELTPETYHDIRIEFRELRGRASIRLMWESPTTGLKKTVVPKENLFQVRHIKGSPFPIDVQPSQVTSADATYPAGTGLLSGIAAITSL